MPGISSPVVPMNSRWFSDRFSGLHVGRQLIRPLSHTRRGWRITIFAPITKTNQKEYMKIVRKIGVVTLVLGMTTALAQAAEKEAAPSGKPDAELRLNNKSIAAGVGFSWGSGTLTY